MTRRAVIGIDPAWTPNEPSGVSLLVESESGWRCLALAPSYEQFVALGNGTSVNWEHRPRGSAPDVERLIQTARQLATPAEIGVIAIDMPVSLKPITERRFADTAISKAYGGRGCAVHSPNAARPGPLADQYRNVCNRFGFQLATADMLTGIGHSLVEVYPHVALLQLLNVDYRVPYKVSRRNRYWKNESAENKKFYLVDAFDRILVGLRAHIKDIPLKIPEASSVSQFTELKRYEDSLDSLVCGWVGIAFLEGRCVSYGDAEGAIWVPDSRTPFD